MTWVVYPADDQKVPTGSVLVAIRRHLEQGSLVVIDGYLHANGQALAGHVEMYVDAIIAGLEPSKEPAKTESADESIVINLLNLPQGPWPCTGRCGQKLDWPGICKECYERLGYIDPKPLDAIASIPMRLRRCSMNGDWMQNISAQSRQNLFEASKINGSIEVTGDYAIQAGVALYFEMLKSTRNNADARFVASANCKTESIRQHRERPLLCLEFVHPKISSALAAHTTVIACGHPGTTIERKLRV